MVSFDSMVGVLGGVVQCSRQEGRDHPDQGMVPVGGDLGRLAMGGEALLR
jgi:hypothetical protein